MKKMFSQWFAESKDTSTSEFYETFVNCFPELLSQIDSKIGLIDLETFELLISQQRKETYDVSLSASIMVKNQEKYIVKTINSVSKIVDDIYILDTGSSDDTVKLIKNLKSRKIILKQVEWSGNFADERNLAINMIPNGNWILVVDSDEQIVSNIDKLVLKRVLAFVEKYLPVNNMVVQLPVGNIVSSAYVLPDRLFKKSANLVYFGKVHEEVRAVDSKLKKMRGNLKIINYGTAPSEVKKFKKEEKYRDLLIKMRQEEPDNPRWFTLFANSDYLKNKKNSEREFQRFALNDPSQDVSIDNLRDGDYLKILMEKFSIFEFQCKNISMSETIASVALKKFPNDTNFLFLKYLNKKIYLDKEIDKTFRGLLYENSKVDHHLSLHDTQQNDDSISVLAAQFLMQLGEYTQAKKVIEDISDPIEGEMVSEEKRLFDL